ncbi:hypothetical protein [Citrobacter freundii]|uniref:hypothetical protein n=1 Tax=Citrobacter freundii TaxID=546 RepID=UPI0015AB27BE|nr:hypothetical protein [Citrobacter freundii]QLD07624.1 hypothetical protein HXS83_14605 [Citrobacter freundii]HCB2577731.1 hypothetical protein [Citrobacter freundii]
MTLEQRVEALEKDVSALKKQVSDTNEALSCFESVIRNRINEFSAYIDTATLAARGISQ